jgi:hypothetical protein
VHSELKSKQGREALAASLAQNRIDIVGLQDWLPIDSAERARGLGSGKPREKFTRITEMLDRVSLRHFPKAAASGSDDSARRQASVR